MTCRVYLIRHGEPKLEEKRTLYGATDLPLSKKGRKSAKALSDVIGRISPDLVVSSPMIRCLDTAEEAGFKPLEVPNLREIDLGEWEMKKFSDLARECPDDLDRRWTEIETFRPPKGESFEDLAKRAVPAIREKLTDRRSLAVFGHLGVFRTILWEEIGIPLKTVFSMEQDYCGIHVLDYSSKGVKLVRSNWSPQIT